METEAAGLEVVKYIRERLQNQLVRIVLRTGQPGQIPEESIVLKYDINDYKTKTELTRQKLVSKVITSLRSYKALVSLETSQQELARIARENARLYQQLEQYAQTLEVQVAQRTRELTAQNQLLKQEIQARKQLEAQLQQANRQLQQLVTIDGLTGVANRRHFDNYLAREWRRLTREQHPLSLLLCDVDYFKLYNDTYGHLAGDDCLRQVAQTLAKIVKRPADLVARYGGEEFAVILPNTDLVGAQYLGQQILAAIRGLEMAHHRSPLNQLVTVSMGVATQIPQREYSCSQLIQAADLALYTAKQQGRARLIVAENNLENPDELCQANRQ